MKQTLQLISAPTITQPSVYVRNAYMDVVHPATTSLEIEIMRSSGSWEIHARWACPNPSNVVKGYTDRFADAMAILVPTKEDAAWITMGSEDAPVDGVLWRADWEQPKRIHSKGLGTSQRADVPAGWRVKSQYAGGHYTLQWLFPKWENLERFQRCAFAIWQGSEQQRAGLKSVSAGWVNANA
ncbi:probably dimethylsulfide dehydrogenase gamma subunit [gamma proteobacterium HdN1]|nr:probably dimethylsulfide dehydrogenase gamma subunit [gamma proteobacterium HdN1]